MALLDSSRINLSGAHFLVVDDNPRFLKIMADLVGSFGVGSITTADSGLRARALLGERRFDLLITDGCMPDYDGYDLVRWLRSRAGDDERIMPAIIVSAHTRQEDIVRGRDCGANFVLAKPISPAILLERIFWIATPERAFIVADAYAGPDRRWRDDGPPPEAAPGRRSADRSREAGEAVADNGPPALDAATGWQGSSL